MFENHYLKTSTDPALQILIGQGQQVRDRHLNSTENMTAQARTKER